MALCASGTDRSGAEANADCVDSGKSNVQVIVWKVPKASVRSMRDSARHWQSCKTIL